MASRSCSGVSAWSMQRKEHMRTLLCVTRLIRLDASSTL